MWNLESIVLDRTVPAMVKTGKFGGLDRRVSSSNVESGVIGGGPTEEERCSRWVDGSW